MSSKPRTVQAVRDEIIAAIAEVHAAALLVRDEQRAHTAYWLDGLFAGVTDRRGIREASAQGLGLYRGGSGSFRDMGLRRGRSWFLRSS